LIVEVSYPTVTGSTFLWPRHLSD